MSIKESALNAITSIAQSDFIRAVTAAGASRRVTVANLAKAIIESYTGSSLAGGNQSVKAALDALNSKDLVHRRTLSSSDDCDTLTQGVYTFSTSLPQNVPSEAQYGTLIVIEGKATGVVYNFQLLSTSGRGLYYRRKQGSASDGFSAWTKVTGTQV